IRLNQNADRISSRGTRGQRLRDHARRRADAALPTESHRAGSLAYRAFFNRSVFGGLDCGEDLVAPDVTASDVVQVTVVSLGDNRVDRTDLLVAGQLQHPFDQRIGDAGDVQRVGQQDRRLDLAKLVDLSRTHQFAEAVADINSRRNFLLKHVAQMRQDRRHARSYIVASDQCGVAYADSGDVGDRVVFTSGQNPDDDAQVAGARAGSLVGRLAHCVKGEK